MPLKNHTTPKYFLSFILLLWPAVLFARPDAHAILQAQAEKNRGYQDEQAQIEMNLMGASGKTNARRYFLVKIQEAGPKILVKVTQPTDISGIGFLSIQENGQTHQWLYLPESRITRRITGAENKGRFLGSEFFYEDLKPFDHEAYLYTYITQRACGLRLCHQIQAVPKKISPYQKLILWIADDLTMHQIDFSDHKGLMKVGRFLQYKKFKGFDRPTKMTMQDVRSGRQTELLLNEIQIQTGGILDVSKQALER